MRNRSQSNYIIKSAKLSRLQIFLKIGDGWVGGGNLFIFIYLFILVKVAGVGLPYDGCLRVYITGSDVVPHARRPWVH